MIGTFVRAPRWVDDALPWAAGTRVRVLAECNGRPHVVLTPKAPPRRARRLVAKHYADDSGATAERAMRAVRAALERLETPPLAVPEASVWHARDRVLEQTAVPGRPLLALLRSSAWRQATVAAARALACLHSLPCRTGHVATLADHLDDLIHPAPAVTAEEMPALASRILAVEHALRAHRWCSPQTPVTVHRDAHARQMTLDGDRVWLVDWDVAADGDAALDVANFAVYVHTHVARCGRAARELFTETYGTIAPSVEMRLPIYTALTYLRLVGKVCRLRRQTWRDRADAYLRRAERALTAVSS